ncbi:DNA adenine methylase [Eubacterium sp.]|uniref:DNA adenine methylase n=1 Tax=Eubacterium sp. TaxID=142586 RepID=UPI0026DF756C|nr:DNA adenine methylase [Eubacterium sp.]MDO5433347.1 DNA adenine methylase [Eubacterium sp.]
MKPVLKYPGAKWNLASWIISYMPPHESYLEPYFGSGAVFFNKEPARIETINDIDGEIVNFFRVCREYPEELARAINLTPWAREELEKSRVVTDDPIERARRTAVGCYMTFGSRRCSRSFRHTTGKYKHDGPDNAKLWGLLPGIVKDVAERLKDAQIENRPAIELIKKHDGPEVLIYLDPPYIRDTRTLHGDQYKFEIYDADHEVLVKTIKNHNGKIILSGYENDLYNDYLKGWKKYSIKSRIERGGTRTETIWLNFEAYEQISIINQGWR